MENLFKVQEAALEEFDGPVEEDDEDRPDASLPDGQLAVQFTGPAADIDIQKLYSQRRAIRSPGWPLYLRVYARYAGLRLLSPPDRFGFLTRITDRNDATRTIKTT